jgi:hypothetical protein
MSYRERSKTQRSKTQKWRIAWLEPATGAEGHGEDVFNFRSIAENIVAELNENSQSRRYSVAAVPLTELDETEHGETEAIA